MAAYKKILEDASQILGLKYDKKKLVAWGVHRGFTLMVEWIQASYQQQINISLCASAQGVPFPSGHLQSVRLPDKVSCLGESFRINMQFTMKGKRESNVEKITAAVRSMLDFIIANGGVNCDERGVADATSVWRVSGKYALLSRESAELLQTSISRNSAAEAEKKENYVLGSIGAVLGAVVGGMLVLLIARLGIISTVCSIVMGLVVVFGYKKLGKKFSKVSMVICILISTVMTFFVFNLNTAMDLYKAFQDASIDVPFDYCLTQAKNLCTLIEAEDTYYHNLILMMLAGVIGAIGASWMEYSNQKEQFEIYKLV